MLRHGEARRGGASAEYLAWLNMLTRARNPRRPGAKNYIGRGITVCDRWLTFENFLEDMGRKPSGKHSLDRVNNDGNYEPLNCRWATRSEQMRNRREESRIAAIHRHYETYREARQTVCKICGKSFYRAGRPHAVTCKEECRREAIRRARLAKKEAAHV